MTSNENESSAQEATNVPEGGISSEMSSMVSLLSGTLEGTSGALGKAYGVMAKSLHQSMEMTQSMSAMLDLLLLDNLNISTRIERRKLSDRPLIVVTTENKSRFPLPGLTGTLLIGRDDNETRTFEAAADPCAYLVSSSSISIINDNKEVRDEAPMLYANTSQDPGALPVTLPPRTKWVHVLELDLKLLDEWLIIIGATFKSPGTGKALEKKHECCIFLLDQCSVTWMPISSDISSTPGWHQTTISTATLRQELQVPPTKSIVVNGRFDLTPTQVQDIVVHGRVDSISEDGVVATCSLWCSPYLSADEAEHEEAAMTLQLLHNVVARLAAELSMTDGINAP